MDDVVKFDIWGAPPADHAALQGLGVPPRPGLYHDRELVPSLLAKQQHAMTDPAQLTSLLKLTKRLGNEGNR